MTGAPAEDAPDAMAGRRIGRYTVIHRIARGGMAELFLAEASDLPSVRRVVVIKRMLPELARALGYREMFLNEARILAALGHPNVVQVIEVGQDGDGDSDGDGGGGGGPFIAMEHVEGESLATIMAVHQAPAAPLPLEHVLHLAGGILSGLHYLHERRDPDGRPLHLIHRDVSPRNVLCSYEGTVKLIDFGIARAANLPGATRHGSVKGTVPYMSPEQCRGLQLDRRTDVFSTGVILHEMTVGQRLFQGEGEFDLFKQIVEGQIPRPGALRADCPPELEAVIMKALAKRPADRFQSAGDMLDAIEQLGRRLDLHPSTRAMRAFMHQRFAERIAAVQSVRERAAGGAAGALTGITRSAAGLDAVDQPEVPPSVEAEVARPRRAARRRIGAAVLALAMLGGAGAIAWRLAARGGPAREVTGLPAAPSPTPATAPPAPAAPERRPPEAPGATPARAASLRAPAVPAAPRRTRAAAQPAAGASGGAGRLVLDSKPWCQVAIDGEPRGPTPLVLELPAGPHRVVLSNEEFHIDRSAVIVVEPNQTVKRRFDFPPAPAAE